VPCGEHLHTIAYDGELVLLDHDDLVRDLAFQALCDQPAEGCLAVREAWHALRRPDAAKELLEALLLDDEDIRQWTRRWWQGLAYLPPEVVEALEQAGVEPASRAQRCRWNLVVLDLPQALRLAYCRSLGPELADLDDGQLRLALIGEERLAEVVPFVRRARREGR
jgi:hypothetical protein